MKIISLTASNIKRLTAVHIEPSGNVIQITGKNGEGKSSVIDAIWMALGGGDVIPDEPIRRGEKKGSIRVDLGELVVRRTFTEKSSYLTVETADGSVKKSPQKILDALIGKLSFDPLAFLRMRDVDQFDALAKHVGIDLSTFDSEKQAVYEARTRVNRDLKQAEAELKSVPLIPDAPDEPIVLSSLLKEIDSAREHNRKAEEQIEKMNSLSEEISGLSSALQAAEERVVRLKEEIKQRRERLDEQVEITTKAEESMIDVSALRDNLANSEEINREVENNQKHNHLKDRVAALRKGSDDLTSELDKIKVDRSEAIRKAGMPVPGLSFGDGVVTFKGIPLSQASGAEKIRVTTAIAMAMNPKLRVIRIEDGSLLDSESMAAIEEMAKDNDYQFWIERVDETGNVGVLIEDGHVSAINGDRIEQEIDKLKSVSDEKDRKHSPEVIERAEREQADPTKLNRVSKKIEPTEF